MTRSVSAAIVVLSLLAVPAVAVDDFAACHQARGDESLAACHRLVRSGAAQLSQVLLSRAKAHLEKRDFDRAIADLEQAVTLNARYSEPSAPAYAYRGLAYEGKGDLDRARADFNMALSHSTHGPYAPDAVQQAQEIARRRLAVIGGAIPLPPPPCSEPPPSKPQAGERAPGC